MSDGSGYVWITGRCSSAPIPCACTGACFMRYQVPERAALLIGLADGLMDVLIERTGGVFNALDLMYADGCYS